MVKFKLQQTKMVCDFKQIVFQITVPKIDLEKELGKHKLRFIIQLRETRQNYRFDA